MNLHSRDIADALIYIRESMDIRVTSIYEELVYTYGVDEIEGEEYLPVPLSEIMLSLASMLRETTDLCVATGVYQRENGILLRPRLYSTGEPVFAETLSVVGGHSFPVHGLHYPHHVKRLTQFLETEPGKHHRQGGDENCV